ncbi:hypothetical protein [Leptolyngbya sp. NIES-2104]|uniref:hypothetical protein n=1 Tax=Leptolyngbya sp. NIES-2104 TaxID=1552121 RepID=UPI0006ECCDE3|nr:hypothetical protein [Leptolyngbya sp. NIES-2104]GAP94407.1 hypothetical protein NIES2104_09180 [Leptolyngbya sp. NIES-2104]
MNKKQPNPINQIQRQGEASTFLNRVLQWICSLQSKEIELFEEERIAELGQLMAKELGVVVFCDLDRNYRTAHNLRILIDEKGKAPSMSKERNYYNSLKVSQFEVRVDISRKGGFFCIRSYARSDDGSFYTLAQKKPKYLLKVCDEVVNFLTENDLIQIPDEFLDRQIDGRNELGGEVTVMTQLFGEI